MSAVLVRKEIHTLGDLEQFCAEARRAFAERHPTIGPTEMLGLPLVARQRAELVLAESRLDERRWRFFLSIKAL